MRTCYHWSARNTSRVADEALRLARDVGAHRMFRSDADALANLRDLVGPPPGDADVVLDCVDAAATRCRNQKQSDVWMLQAF